MSINNNDQQNNTPMAQNEMPTLDPIVQAYSPLLQQQFQPLGATIFMALQRLHQNDKYSFRLKEYAYWCYLVKHPEVVGEYEVEPIVAEYEVIGKSDLHVTVAVAPFIYEPLHVDESPLTEIVISGAVASVFLTKTFTFSLQPYLVEKVTTALLV